jgi:hypothetical protein
MDLGARHLIHLVAAVATGLAGLTLLGLSHHYRLKK